MKKTYLTLDKFKYIGNIPNVYSPAYSFVVEKGYRYLTINNEPARMRITTAERFTGVNTSVDFTITPSYLVAPFSIEGVQKSNQIAVAFDETVGKVSKCVHYDESTNQLVFNAISGGGTSDTVSIYYLLAEGNLRLEVEYPGKNVLASTALFEGSLLDINTKNQQSYKDFLFIYSQSVLDDAYKLSIYVLSDAPVILDSRDFTDVPSSMTINVAPSYIFLPVMYERTDQPQPGGE